MSLAYPTMRPIEAFPVAAEGEPVICLRDPAGYASGPVIVPVPLFVHVIALLDGCHTPVDIQAAYMRRTGDLLPRALIDDVVAKLDDALLLETPRFTAHVAEVVRAFAEAPVRPAAHAGVSYAADPEALAQQLAAYFLADGGPGRLPVVADGAGPSGTPPSGGHTAPLLGALIPHIDLRTGGTCYAHAYAQMASATPADLFIVLGTAHQAMRQPCAVLRKDFATPLGLVRADEEFIDAFARAAGPGVVDEIAPHRTEHSIEFQCVFLRYVYGNRRPFTVVPILIGSFHEAVVRGRSPRADPAIGPVLDALAATVARSRRRLFLIASGDLAHVGPKFGDPHPVDEGVLAAQARADRVLLACVEEGDPEALFRAIHTEQDSRRVCGFPPLYVLVSLLEGHRGSLLRYDQWHEQPTGSAVTFASLTITQ